MRSETVTTVLEADSETVFSYLADIENLPKWATEFARELKHEDGEYKVVNGLGEFFFAIHADPDTGVVDMYAGPEKAQMALFQANIEANTEQSSAFDAAPTRINSPQHALLVKAGLKIC